MLVSFRRGVVGVTAMAVVVAGCGGESSASGPVATEDEVLRIVAPEPTTGLDPAEAVTTYSTRVMELIYDTLVDYDGENEVVPSLASEWDVTPDGLSYRFVLRSDAKFSDGQAITASDVVFSIDRMAGSPVMEAPLEVMESVEEVDSTTVEVTLSEPSRPFLNALATPGAAAILSQDAVESDEEYFTSPTRTSGPWHLEEWLVKDHITLRRNDNYWDPERPAFVEIQYTFNEDPTSAAAALESGTADMYYPMAPLDANRLRDAGKISYFNPPAPGILAFGMDRTEPPFDDVRVRQAIAYLTPRQDGIDTCWLGSGSAAYGGVILEGVWAFEPGLEKYKSEDGLDEAELLLDDAGWELDSGGVRRAAGVVGVEDGTPLEFTVPFENNWNQGRCYIQLFKSFVERAGAVVHPEAHDAATFYPDIAEGKFDFWFGGNTYGSVDDMMQKAFTTDGAENAIICQVSDTRLDDLVSQARATPDLDEARALYLEAQQILQEDVPCVVMGTQWDIIATSPSVVGYYARPDSSNRALIGATKEPSD